jgi:hypothetical protein
MILFGQKMLQKSSGFQLVSRWIDWPAWYFDAKGQFSVKSAYKFVVEVRE